MLKIVIFDSGYGGELFADRIKEELPIVEVIRVIDWRNAEGILSNPKQARKIAEAALRPYIGQVDLIFFANHLLSLTSLKYFRRHYKNQAFLGFKLPDSHNFNHRRTLILTTRALTNTISFYNYLFRLKCDKKIINLDSWPSLIDDGELSDNAILYNFNQPLVKNFKPEIIVLTCSHFSDIKPVIRRSVPHNTKIVDSFELGIREIAKTLKIRGGLGKKFS